MTMASCKIAVIVLFVLCVAMPIFGQVVILTAMIRNKLLRNRDNSYLLIGVLWGDFLACCATLWQTFMPSLIDRLDVQPFFTKGQCLLFEAPNIAGMTISQVATLSLAVDRLSSLRDPMAYYQKDNFKFASWWLSVAGVLGLVHAIMPQIANDIGTVMHCTGPTWPGWFRMYWAGFSIIISALVLSAYLFVFVLSRAKRTPKFTDSATSMAQQRSEAREKLVTKTVLRVLSVYVLFWGLPSFLYNSTVFINVTIGAMLGLLMMFGEVLCAAANVIFLLMKEDIRSGVRSLFGCSEPKVQFISGTSGQLGTGKIVGKVHYVS